MDTLTRIDKEKKWDGNPRNITKKQMANLKDTIRRLGDLSGVVFCRNNDAYVGGNMRSEVLDGAIVEITERYKTPTSQKTVALGYIIHPDTGEKFAFREVEFSSDEFREACITANAAGGRWDFDILANNFEVEEIRAWGLDDMIPSVPEPEDPVDFGGADTLENIENSVVLLYSEDEARIVRRELLKHGRTAEDAVWNLLGLGERD